MSESDTASASSVEGCDVVEEEMEKVLERKRRRELERQEFKEW